MRPKKSRKGLNPGQFPLAVRRFFAKGGDQLCAAAKSDLNGFAIARKMSATVADDAGCGQGLPDVG